MEVVQKAAANGAQVLCKAAGYDDLPEKWRAISVPSENAVFPLIVIDDKVAWLRFTCVPRNVQRWRIRFFNLMSDDIPHKMYIQFLQRDRVSDTRDRKPVHQ